jgi:hypothetical protein
MTNADPTSGPQSSEFRRLFGSKARDPGSMDQATRRAEIDHWNRSALSFQFDRVLYGPPLVFAARYLASVLPTVKLPGPGFALGCLFFWAVGVALWTPYIIWRVDGSTPRGDTARATALLGYGLLAWPLSIIPAVLAPRGQEAAVAFPFVFAWGATAMILAALSEGPPRPSARRTAMLSGAALIYLALTVLAAVFLVAPWLGFSPFPDGSSLIPWLVLVAIVGVMTGIATLKLVQAAGHAWRGRLNATTA